MADVSISKMQIPGSNDVLHFRDDAILAEKLPDIPGNSIDDFINGLSNKIVSLNCKAFIGVVDWKNRLTFFVQVFVSPDRGYCIGIIASYGASNYNYTFYCHIATSAVTKSAL